jgi:polysaccharide biosynthesis transport protein
MADPFASSLVPFAAEAPSSAANSYRVGHSAEEGLRLRECWLTIRKRLALVLIMVAAALLLAIVAIVVQQPRYTAIATLLIQPETPQVLDITQLVANPPSNDEHDFYKTQEDLLRSPALAAMVIRTLGLNRTPLLNPPPEHGLGVLFQDWPSRLLALGHHPAPPITDEQAGAELGASTDAIRRYLRMLEVAPVLGTELVTVSFTATDPVVAARIANAHARCYIDWGLELRHQASTRAQDFLRGQLVGIKQRVEASEAALNSYRHSKGIISFAIDDKDQIAEARMAALTTAMTDAETERIRLEAEMQLVRAGGYDSLPAVIHNQMIETLKPQIDQLASQYAAMSAHFTDRWPDLAKLKAQLAEARTRLDQEVANVAQGVTREYQEALVREQSLRAAVDEEKERDLARNDAALQDAVLERAAETNRQLYEDVLKRMQEMGVAEEAPLSSVNIVNSAIVPRVPSEPKPLKILAITWIIALLAGVGLAFFLDQNDQRFKDTEEIESVLHLPRLAVVPDYLRLHNGGSRPSHMEDAESTIASAALSAFGNPISPGCIEPYRMIRMALLFSRAGGSPRSILFTSAIPQEGKTLTVANVAALSAEMGARTLLVDGDLRRPQCHRLFASAPSAGLSDVLAGQRTLANALNSPAANLTLLCAGSATPNPSALLISSSMRGLLTTAQGEYDCVMIDSAPVMSASDTTGLATMVDGVVLIIGQDTPRKAVLESYSRLLHAGARMLGFVFNRVDLSRPQHRGHKQYYRYHNYYAEAPRPSDGMA